MKPLIYIAFAQLTWECTDCLGPHCSEEEAMARMREVRDSYADDRPIYDLFYFQVWELGGLKQLGEGKLFRPEEL